MHTVILAGGAGTRFWPLSRRDRPKQLLSLFGSRSLVRQTVDRVSSVSDSVSIVCREGLVEPIREALDGLDVAFIVEPAAKNTLPAIALAAAAMKDDAPIAILPSDHYIRDEEKFREVLSEAADAARDLETIVTIGIEPTRPETGFGYIELGDEINESLRDVERFVEKPDLETAVSYLAAQKYLWNAGMFVFRPSVLFGEMARQTPNTFKAFDELRNGTWTDDAVTRAFEAADATSIDFGIMEGAEYVTVVPGAFGWSDVGHWGAMFELTKPDQDGNVTHGDPVLVDTKDSLVWANSRTVAAVGLSNIAVVETEDAVLVCDRSAIQQVRAVVPNLPDDLK